MSKFEVVKIDIPEHLYFKSLPENCCIIITKVNFIIPYKFLNNTKLIICSSLTFEIIEEVSSYNLIFFDVKMNRFLFHYLKIFSMKRNINVICYFYDADKYNIRK